jgi:hypothetical protein
MVRVDGGGGTIGVVIVIVVREIVVRGGLGRGGVGTVVIVGRVGG